jgi:hypothetical protein
VIDFGILCYGNAALPEGSMVGDVLAGEVRFFFPYPAVYEEGFDAAAPRSTYSWRIDRIRLGATPWLVGDDGVRRRDPNKIGYLDVESTNAETDDDGSAEYLLDCQLLGERGALWLRWDRLRRKARRQLRQARARRQEPGLVLPQLERGRWESLPPR